uniref:Endonuclease/exonuclease/phosphatase domain-containing protein n=1 Tax=Aegilops tauschii subsp. strangulata TaxID=200361 RepID=A0A453JXU9_AEGTS
TRGGAATFWESSKVTIATQAVGQFSITASASVLHSNLSFWITTVSDPGNDARKDEFLDEMIRIRPPQGEPWLINGDFNIIYEARDKSNHNLNIRVMGRF